MLLSLWSAPARPATPLSAPIPSQPLAQALVDFAHQTGLHLLYESKLAALRQSHETPADPSAANALTLLLQGTGLAFQFLNPQTIRIYEPAPVAAAVEPPETDLPTPRVEPAAHRADSLDEILVTGTRRTEHLSDLEDVQMIPASVSVIGGATLVAQNAVQLSDYAASVPGLNILSGGMPGSSGVAIRGVSPLAEATSVVFYLDEVPIGASGRWGYAGATALELLPYDLQRLEVQRGPQGTFGGAGAEIGSIKYLFNPPDASHFEARTSADVSTIHDASQPGESVRAMVNAPIIEELLAVRVALYDSYTPGYIDNAYSGAKDINVLRQYGGRIAALWHPAESLSLSITAFSNRIEQQSPSEVASRGVVSVPNTGEAYIVDGVGSYGELADNLAFEQTFKKSLDNYSAILRWNSGLAELMSVTGYSRNQEHYVQDYSAIDGSYFPTVSGGAVPAGLAEIEEDVNLDKFTQELRISSPSGQRLDWVLGAFYTHERVQNQTFEYAFDDSYRPIAAFDPHLAVVSRPSSFNEIAEFGDITWQLSDRFDVTGGIRSAQDSQKYANFSAGLFSQPNFTGQGGDTLRTWMAAARYRIEPTVMIYGRMATGTQPSSLLVVQSGPSSAEKGETALNSEIGVKSQFLDRRALMDLTIFRLDRARTLATVYESGFFRAAPGVGDAKAQGLELTSSYAPLPGLTLGYNAAYTKSEFTRVNSAARYQLTGFQLENVPKWAMSITLNYDWALPNLWRAHAGGDFRSVGREWSSYVQSRSLGGYPTTELPSYSVVDFNASVGRRALSVKFFARNLANKRAYLNALVIVNDFSTPVQVENYLLQPRTIGVGLDYNF